MRKIFFSVITKNSNWEILTKNLVIILFTIILSTRVLEWLIILVGLKIKDKIELEARKQKNSLVLLCSL